MNDIRESLCTEKCSVSRPVAGQQVRAICPSRTSGMVPNCGLNWSQAKPRTPRLSPCRLPSAALPCVSPRASRTRLPAELGEKGKRIPRFATSTGKEEMSSTWRQKLIPLWVPAFQKKNKKKTCWCAVGLLSDVQVALLPGQVAAHGRVGGVRVARSVKHVAGALHVLDGLLHLPHLLVHLPTHTARKHTDRPSPAALPSGDRTVQRRLQRHRTSGRWSRWWTGSPPTAG